MRYTNGSQPAEQSEDQPRLRLRATIGEREEYTFQTAAGVQSPESFRTPELRLLDVLTEDPPDTLLVPDANYGVTGVVMATFVDTVWMTATSIRAATLCRRNARLNRVSDQTTVAVTADLQALPTTFDAAALAPTGYTPADVVEQRMADTLATLSESGTLYLAATPRVGLMRYKRTLRDLCSSVSTVHSGDSCTVIRATRQSNYEPPKFAESRTIQWEIDGTMLSLVTYPGLFSTSKVDKGTKALARHIEIADCDVVLDLACGYGPLGIYAALSADCRICLTDDDCVATACATASTKQSGVSNQCRVVTADSISGVRGESFDRILCNPPTHAGSRLLHSLMRGASEILTEDGKIELVHHQGVPFRQYLDPYFNRISTTDNGDYRLVTAWPSESSLD